MQQQMKLQYRCLNNFRLNTHPAHVTMGRVGATAIRSTHRCRWFCFCFVLVLFRLIVAFPCCCLPSMMMFMSFWRLLGMEKEGEYFIFP